MSTEFILLLDDAAAQPLAILRRLIEEDYLHLGDGYPETAKIYRELKALADPLEDLVLFPTFEILPISDTCPRAALNPSLIGR